LTTWIIRRTSAIARRWRSWRRFASAEWDFTSHSVRTRVATSSSTKPVTFSVCNARQDVFGKGRSSLPSAAATGITETLQPLGVTTKDRSIASRCTARKQRVCTSSRSRTSSASLPRPCGPTNRATTNAVEFASLRTTRSAA